MQKASPDFSRLKAVWQRLQTSVQLFFADRDSPVLRLLRLFARIVLVAYFVFCALFLSVRYLILPQISAYKADVEKMLSSGLGRQVSISRIDASWYGFHPLLKLKGLSVHDPDGEIALQLPQVTAAVSWWSFAVFDLRLALLEIDSPELDIRRDKAGQFFIAGLPANTSSQEQGGGLDWLLRQNGILIRNATLHWLDEMRGAPELSLNNLSFVLENDGRRHRMRFLAPSPVAESGDIDIRADFVHPFFAKRISESGSWKGAIYMELPDTALDSWKPYLDLPYGLKRGGGSVQAWMAFDQGRIADLTVDLDLKDVSVQLDSKLPELSLLYLSGRVSAKEFAGSDDADEFDWGDRPHEVQLEDIRFESADGIHMDGVDFSEKFVPADNGKPSVTEVSADRLELDIFAKLMQYLPLPADQRQMIADFAPTGRLNHFRLRLEGEYPAFEAYQLEGQFVGLSMKARSASKEVAETSGRPHRSALPAIPGFSNMTGRISANQHGGSMVLDSNYATLDLPAYLPKADWVFEALMIDAQWKLKEGSELAVDVRKASLNMDEVSIEAWGKYMLPLADDEAGPGWVDASIAIPVVEMQKIRNFVPLQAEPVLKNWLSKAFDTGTATDIKARMRGNLKAFPFTDPSKTAAGDMFLVEIRTNDASLNYAPTEVTSQGKLMWEPIQKINGTVTIRGPQIVIHADNAILSNTRLSNVDVVIPDMLAEQPMLNVVGQADGELQHFLRFVNASPVNTMIGGLTEEAKASGHASLKLKMQMPLSHMADTTVQGTVQLADNDIKLFPDLPLLGQSRGTISFNEKGFGLENIKAQFLGGQVGITGGNTQNKEVQVNASGTFTAEGLRKNYAGTAIGKLMGQFSGSTPYTVSIKQKGSEYPHIIVDAPLRGFGINLPRPVGKTAADTRGIRVEVNPLASTGKLKRDEIRIRYDDTAEAVYERQKSPQGWQVTRGGIGVGTKPVLKSGLWFSLQTAALDLNEWLDVLEPVLESGGKGASTSDTGLAAYVEPQNFTVAASKLHFMEFDLDSARVNGNWGKGFLQADVMSSQLKGHFQWEEPGSKYKNGKLTARFADLTIPRSAPVQIEDIIKRERVKNMPAIDIAVQNLTLFDIRLGQTEVQANNVLTPLGKEWRIQKLAVNNPDARLQSTGSWIIDSQGRQETRMNYELAIHDAGKLLDRFGYANVLSGGKGKMDGSLSWSGLPYSLDVPSLSGKINLDVGKGQFIKVEPGMAKLLGVLSMQSLPRRLVLDFKDVFSEGFAFDEITAHAQINRGVASTDNLTMRGVTATVLMDGSVDIAQETQDLHVAVLPEINAGMASLAYSLINPAIGVGTFLAQLFLKDPLSKTFTYEYAVTGSWTDPQIKKLERGQSNVIKKQNANQPTQEEPI